MSVRIFQLATVLFYKDYDEQVTGEQLAQSIEQQVKDAGATPMNVNLLFSTDPKELKPFALNHIVELIKMMPDDNIRLEIMQALLNIILSGRCLINQELLTMVPSKDDAGYINLLRLRDYEKIQNLRSSIIH